MAAATVDDVIAAVKYGYSSVGRVEEGPDTGPHGLTGRLVFCLYPHQDVYCVPAAAVVPFRTMSRPRAPCWRPTWRPPSTCCGTHGPRPVIASSSSAAGSSACSSRGCAARCRARSSPSSTPIRCESRSPGAGRPVSRPNRLATRMPISSCMRVVSRKGCERAGHCGRRGNDRRGELVREAARSAAARRGFPFTPADAEEQPGRTGSA